jgi:hypothetical protein
MDPIILLTLNQQSLSQIMTILYLQNLLFTNNIQLPNSITQPLTHISLSLSLSLSQHIIVLSKNKTHLALHFILKTFKICVIHDLVKLIHPPPNTKTQNPT